MDEAKWYVAHTYSGYENNVRANILKTVENRNLQDQIFDVLVPVETVAEVNNGKTKTVERKVFPGYVFVKMVMNDDSWYVVRNTRGVTGFVGPGSKPVPLSPAEVRSFGIDDENGSVEETKPVVQFAGKIGDQAKILSGSCENMTGQIVNINESRQCVTINVEMFERETPVEVDFTNVKVL